jgi:hypothetical protein
LNFSKIEQIKNIEKLEITIKGPTGKFKKFAIITPRSDEITPKTRDKNLKLFKFLAIFLAEAAGIAINPATNKALQILFLELPLKKLKLNIKVDIFLYLFFQILQVLQK